MNWNRDSGKDKRLHQDKKFGVIYNPIKYHVALQEKIKAKKVA